MTLGVASAFGLARGLGQEISNLEAWCARLSGSWHEAAEAFRTCAPSLAEFLSLLENPHHSGGGVRLKAAEMEAVSVMLRRSAELAPLSNRLTVLESEGRLGRDWADILASAMHLHCIRLLGGSSAMEKLAMGILFRAVNGFLRSGAKAREV